MALAGGSYASSIPLTRLTSSASLTRAQTEERRQRVYDQDVNGTDDQWDIDSGEQGHNPRLARALSRTISTRRARSRSNSLGGVREETEKEKTEWEMAEEVRGMRKDLEQSGLPARQLGLEWNNLTVRGKGADAVVQDTVLSQFDIVSAIKSARKPTPEKVILEDNFGVVKPGEMLLVLARPGGGATTLLRLLSNQREGYSDISGDVHFGSMDHKEAQKFRGQIVMNGEEEIFYPSMTVHQTISFAAGLKAPMNLPQSQASIEEYLESHEDFLLRSMGIAHTKDTKVGDAYTRGVSGGERKRVSIIECLATKGSVFAWDNSTRGLDASTALSWAKAIRTLSDVLGLTCVVTLYQAGNGIYELFDKVMVLELGKQTYYGMRQDAQPFFESLGFEYTTVANVGDFLTGVLVPTERRIAKGRENDFPKTAEELRRAYQASPIYSAMRAELGYSKSDAAKTNTETFRKSVAMDRHKNLPKNSELTVPFPSQFRILTRRQFQMIWGSKVGLGVRLGSTLVQALVSGSLFYMMPQTANGLFLRGGTLFFSVLYNSLVAMSEVQESFEGRAVLIKHKQFAFFHPAAFVIAQIISDIPILLVQITVFALVVYFMTGLLETAGAFFTYYLFVWVTTLTMTAFFRAIGSAFGTFNAASKVSGLAISVCTTYAGYIISRPNMHPWFEWLFYLTPLSYALESLFINELSGREFPCTGSNLIPEGADYTTQYASCAGIGGASGTTVYGTAYLATLDYSYGHKWRNLGLLFVFWIGFVAITAYFTTFKLSAAASSAFLTFVRGKTPQHIETVPTDAESGSQVTLAGSAQANSMARPSKEKDSAAALIKNTSVFTWRDLKYTVKVPGGERLLLDSISGYVKPGQLGALMGSSGAGKTTLLDVLAQRKTDGTITGQIHVDGRPLPVSFQRSAGYCEQLDVHESLATVREALEFSAILRQPRETPRAEKLAYVDTIIQLLELQDIADALIGTPGQGLGVEQRKRLTIGVELVAKPSILIFLDEPTSGLDSQSAFSIVRFLRKLADVGQTILVTIHQPSASLFYQFDTLLLLAKGGKTVYNGEIGHEAATIKQYFAREGAPCPENVNVGEYMISVVSGPMAEKRDWHEVWLASPENKMMLEELDRIEADANSRPVAYEDDGREFATSTMEQFNTVLKRNSVSLLRDTDYVNNKFMLHVTSALFNGFTFWMIGDSAADLQNKLFSIFTFIFVAPGVMAQVQPLFIARRDIFEAREKKARMYSWWAFCCGLIVSEIPYLLICAVLYFFCWWWTAGFPGRPGRAGPAFLEVLLYEFLYTGMAQFISAYAPNAAVASLVQPIILGTLISFSGVLVPYSAITAFWRYWLYYLNPFTYLMGAQLWFGIWGTTVTCTSQELATFDTPNGETCQAYLSTYLTEINPGANLLNPQATSGCEVCSYTTGTNYLNTLNITHAYDGWRDVAITALFCVSSYALVFGLMKLRTKQSKKAE